MRLVLGHGVKIAAVGVVLGLLSAAALARVMRTLLYEVSGTDPVTFAGVALMAVAIAALACYVPARRATSVDPMTALRAEYPPRGGPEAACVTAPQNLRDF